MNEQEYIYFLSTLYLPKFIYIYRNVSKNAEEDQTSSDLSQQMTQQLVLGSPHVPEGVCNFDKENWDDIFEVSHYAADIFKYLKNREVSC